MILSMTQNSRNKTIEYHSLKKKDNKFSAVASDFFNNTVVRKNIKFKGSHRNKSALIGD